MYRDAELLGDPGRGDSHLPATDLDAAAVGGLDAEQGEGDVRSAGADEPREAEDLARVEVEFDPGEDPLAAEAAYAAYLPANRPLRPDSVELVHLATPPCRE